jgi:formate/nitrite transporter FocA (FNT family)
MFFLPLGFVSSVLGYAVPEGVAGISATGILANLSAATLGNIVGGVVFVGLAYYFIDGRHRIGEPA